MFGDDDEAIAGSIWRSSTVLVLGAILGVLFIGCAGVFQYWIEDKAIHTAQSLEQGAAHAVTVPADAVNPANDGKLVHLSGEAATKETLTDPDFGIAVGALRLTREVELYQWKETKTETKKGNKTVVTYKYAQVWSKDKPAKNFAEPAGRVNPAEKPYADSKIDAKEVKVGAFTLNAKQVERIPANDTLTITGAMLTRAPANLKGQLAADPEGCLFVAAQPGHGPDAPGVGDVRIRYKMAKSQVISLAAKQTQATFEPFTPQAGEPVDLLKPGSHSAQALFEGAQSSIRLVGWVARVLSVLVMTVGLFLVIRLWKNVGRAATGGGLYDVGLAFLALGFAIPLVVVIVGSRWVTHQPVLGSGLLGGGLVAALGLFLVARRKPARAVKATVDVENSYTKAPAQGEMHALINRAIELGAPVYNGGDPAACYEIYAATARSIIKGPAGDTAANKRLRRALDQCGQLTDPDQKAWAMRHAFDAILAGIAEHANPGQDIALARDGGEKLDYLDITLERVPDEQTAGPKAFHQKNNATPAQSTEAAPVVKKDQLAPVVEEAASAPTAVATCPECNRRLKIATEIVGKRIRCPVCKATFVA